MKLNDYIELNEGQDKLAKIFKQGKTHKFIFSKKKGKEALKKAEIDRIKKTLFLEIDRISGIPAGYTLEKGLRVFDVNPSRNFKTPDWDEETGYVSISTIHSIIDGNMKDVISKVMKKLGYKLEKPITKGTFVTASTKVKLKNEEVMKHSFTEYLEEREVQQIQLELNEDLVTIAGAVLGYSSVGLLVAWAGSLIVKGYVSVGRKAIVGIVKAWKGIFGKSTNSGDVNKKIVKMKVDQSIRVAGEKMNKDRTQYNEKLGPVFAAIGENDSKKASEAFKKSGVSQSPIVNRVITSEIVKVLGEPPLHYGNTGNKAYMFVKNILGIKVAQTTAKVVSEALKKQSDSLIKDVDER